MIEPSLSMGIGRLRKRGVPVPLIAALLAMWGLGFWVGQRLQTAPDLARLVRLGLLFFGGALSGLAVGAAKRHALRVFAPLKEPPSERSSYDRSRPVALPGGDGAHVRGSSEALGPALEAIELQAPSDGLAQKSPEAALRWENLAQASHALLGLLSQTLKDCRVALVRPQRVREHVRLERCAAKPDTFDVAAWAEPLFAALAAQQTLRRGPVPLGLGHARALAMPVWPEEGGSLLSSQPASGWVHLLVEREGAEGFVAGEAELVRTLGEQLTLSHKLEVALKSSQADLGRLAHLATTDGLTELANRRHFEGVFALQLARATRYKRALSLLLIDIDHFKAVNDTFGHAVGDEVLQDVARVLMRTARCTDLVGRYGGEEFVVLMDETDLKGALRTAERMREALVNQPLGHTVQLHKTASFGVAAFPEHGSRAAELLSAADAALYQAKRAGRDQIVLFEAHPAQERRPG